MSPAEACPEAFRARPVVADPALAAAYFAQVASYEADRLRASRRLARAGFAVGAVGAAVGLAGALAVAALVPLKTVVPLVFRVDMATGVVERVYDVRGGPLAAGEAQQRYFLWQYVRLRQGYSAVEAHANFDAVALMSAPRVQADYAAAFRGSNPASPQVMLGRDGTASVRWLSTSFLGPKLAQLRFVQSERKGDGAMAVRRMLATIGFDFAPGSLSATAINVNPLGFVVTSYRVDEEATP
ncbi:virB8 family protein [Azospirillum picis]|uniref:Type IV secretion system protein VirB8 n=1 Tax=Azospirillum picis TaxID=488438 RepID=A0ABU0MUM3_9PROT|nr:VirB8/TrbF family protein [Azospirillum picis]MBP2300915.1 type IV secretion system protein VirB8 [Azospirillum picis]MDQ0537019.1 type IV secretion system protein VirB8 [Azospirillum picis]